MEKRESGVLFCRAHDGAMDIINRDRVRDGTGMLQVLDAAIGVRRLIAASTYTFHPIEHVAPLRRHRRSFDLSARRVRLIQ